MRQGKRHEKKGGWGLQKSPLDLEKAKEGLVRKNGPEKRTGKKALSNAR